MRRSTKRMVALGVVATAGILIWRSRQTVAGWQMTARDAMFNTERQAVAAAYDYLPPPIQDPSEYELVVPS